MALSLRTFLNQLCQKGLQDICTIFHLTLKRNHNKTSYVHPVSHREVSIALESSYKEEQERFIHDQLSKQAQSFLFARQFRPIPLQHRAIVVAREQYHHGVGSIIEERYTSAGQVAREIRHLRLQLGERLLTFGRDTKLQNVHLLLHVLQYPIAFRGLAPVRNEEGDEHEHQDNNCGDHPDQSWFR